MMSDISQLPQDFVREQGLIELERTLSLAEVRCLLWNEIRPRLRMIWKDPQAKELTLRVQEMDLTERAGKQLAKELKCLSTVADQLQTKDKYRLDNMLMQLAKALPNTELYEHALADLNHCRKHRRIGAYKALRKIGICKELAPRLVERYRETGDQDLLTLIARSPEAVVAIDSDLLLSELEEHYWRVRVIEAIISKYSDRARRYVSAYPSEFVHAVGRLRATHFVSEIRELVRSHLSDWELLSLSAWTLGICGDRKGVGEIRRILNRELTTSRRPVCE